MLRPAILALLLVAPLLHGGSCKPGLVSAERIFPGGTSAAYGDFNEDRRTDIAYTSYPDVRVALGGGNGTFFPPTREQESDVYDRIVEAVDMNRDGHVDLVYRAAVALGDGKGHFGPKIVSKATFAEDWRFADVDGDGLKDFVELLDDGITIERASGDGTFDPPRQVVAATPSGPYGRQTYFSVADFDGDGRLDVYIADWEIVGKYVHLKYTYWWNGGNLDFSQYTRTDVTITTPQEFNAPLDGFDFDGDGAADMLLWGDGPGKMTLQRTVGRKIASSSIEASGAIARTWHSPLSGVGDFDSDGFADALFQNGTVVWGPHNATRINADAYDLVPSTADAGIALHQGAAAIADINSDGIPDIVGTGGGAGLFAVFGGSSRELTGATLTPGFFPTSSVGRGDINSDGIMDFVATDLLDRKMVDVYLGDGRGAFAPGTRFENQTHEVNRVRLADLDGDGKLDLLMGESLRVAFGDGSGRFATPLAIENARLLDAGLIDSSGRQGAFVSRGTNLEALTLTSDHTAVFETIATIATNTPVLAFDVDNDRITELLIGGSNEALIIRKTSTSWNVAEKLAQGSMTSGAAADLDTDGFTDLVLCNEASCTLWLGTASGHQATPSQFRLRGWVRDVVVTDVDGDERPEVVVLSVGNYGDPAFVATHRNTGGATFESAGGSEVSWATRLFLVGSNVVVLTEHGPEVLRSGCVAPRIRFSFVQYSTKIGDTATVLVTMKGSIYGSPSIYEGANNVGVPLQLGFPSMLIGLPSLAQGMHTYTIRYSDPYFGPYEETFSLRVPPPRRRSTNH